MKDYTPEEESRIIRAAQDLLANLSPEMDKLAVDYALASIEELSYPEEDNTKP